LGEVLERSAESEPVGQLHRVEEQIGPRVRHGLKLGTGRASRDLASFWAIRNACMRVPPSRNARRTQRSDSSTLAPQLAGIDRPSATVWTGSTRVGGESQGVPEIASPRWMGPMVADRSPTT
jgi:hypothetical protein